MTIRWNERPVDTSLPPLPDGARPPRVPGEPDVWIDPQAEAAALAHLGNVDVEQGGLLIGDAWAEAAGALAHLRVLDVVPADEAFGTAVSLRMAAGVWSRARDRLRPGLRVIGWYHSHPGLTAFFSDTDRRTQRAIFHHRWSLGWVIDPFEPAPARREAFYVGPDCRPIARRAAPRWG